VGDGVVVYGTGYEYTPWIGTRWFGRPMTYGLGAHLMYSPPSNWRFGFGAGWSASPLDWGWGISAWWEPLGWDWRGERYPWVWQNAQAVRVPSDGSDGREVGAWRAVTGRSIYERWRRLPPGDDDRRPSEQGR
jgi:hypothetical protein